jgi:hypothetical protein
MHMCMCICACTCGIGFFLQEVARQLEVLADGACVCRCRKNLVGVLGIDR